MMAYFHFFSRFGNVISAQIQRERPGGKSRGFGFVTFEDPASVEKVLAEQGLSLDGRKLEVKSAIPRGLVATVEAERQLRPKKIFVAGLTETVTEGDLKDHFSQYGRVVDAIIQKDRSSGESRGFGFVTFDSGDAVEKVIRKGSQKLGDKCVMDVKIARPKENPVMGGPPGASVWSSTFGPGGSTWGPQGSGPGTWGSHPSSTWGPPTNSWGPSSSQYSSQYHPSTSPYSSGGPTGGGGSGPPPSSYSSTSSWGGGSYGSSYSSNSPYSNPSQYQNPSSGWNTPGYSQPPIGMRNLQPPTQHPTQSTGFDSFNQYGAFRRGRAPVPRAGYHPYQR